MDRGLAFAVVCALGVLAPGVAQARTCSDYSTQADAQRAADTRDGDGDGVYCEVLPCPCVRPGSDGRATHLKAKPRKRAQVIAARITSVVDGDTIKVRAFNARRELYTVRLIGIDTSEAHRPGRPVECGGRRASGKMLALAFTDPVDTDGDSIFDEEAGTGRRVTVVTDPTQDTFDRYGRLLAYVTTRAGVSLQTAQLSAGWAKVYVFGGRPFRQVSRFRAASARARAGRRGVWRLCSGNFHRSL